MSEHHAHLLEARLSPELQRLCPPELRGPLGRYLAGDISGELALMHCALQLGSAERVIGALQQLVAALPETGEIAALLRLAQAHRAEFARLEPLLAGLGAAPAASIAATRQLFDAAVAIAPEAAVALYSLGSAEILARATAEIVALLQRWQLVAPGRRVLDIGCGIGRLEAALAPYVADITGIDVSAGMIAEARRRCCGLPNVALAVADGRGIDGFAVAAMDLVLAVDSFPYLVAAGAEIVTKHVADARRLLRPGGALAIFNYSYRGDLDADRRDVAFLAAAHGFVVRCNGTRDLRLWDGVAFLLTRVIPPP